MNTDMHSLESLSKKSVKARAKELVGSLAASVCLKRTLQLYAAPTAEVTGWRDNAIMAFLKDHSLRTGNANFLEALHADTWRGKTGAVFSDNCDHRFKDLFLAKQQEDADVLVSAWNEMRPRHIVEFGCSSGLLLQYLTETLEGVESATGIELNEEQVKKNQQSEEFDSRIRFVCGDAREWLFENSKPNSLFVTNGGVLEYFGRERLNEMISHIAHKLKPALFFSIEPVAIDHDWKSTPESVPFGEEASFSHNYADVFASIGFEVLHQRATDFDAWRMMATVARST